MNKPVCFNDCKAPVVATVSGAPICQSCFDHYLGLDKPQPEYGDGRAYARQFE